MRVAIVLGSQRKEGTCRLIEKRIRQIKNGCDYDFIRMAEVKIEGCLACAECSHTGQCILPSSRHDMFQDILHRLKSAEAILVITPIYSPYPSRLTALMERLLSVSYFPHVIGKLERPLKGKKTGIICYGSSKIEDDKQLKLLFQKYLMDDYSFTEVNYPYLNAVAEPNTVYPGVVEYVEDVIRQLGQNINRNPSLP
jgi:multimeric flavodoxin WrbA